MSVITYPHPHHLNGTGEIGLSKQHSDVLRSLDRAIEAVRYATPHGRDWQAAEDGEYILARQASLYRVEALQAIREDVYQGWIAIREEES